MIMSVKFHFRFPEYNTYNVGT